MFRFFTPFLIAGSALAEVHQGLPEISAADLRAHVTYLASDELQGRLTGTEGEKLATRYAADVLKASGIQGYGFDEDWFQNFEFTAGVALGEKNLMSTTPGEVWKIEQDWRPLSFSQTGTVLTMPIVFAGYGIETPDDATGDDGKKIEPYSSYAHLEVKDKWVMVLRYVPEGVSQERRNLLNRYSSLRHKALTARQKGAKGIIVVSGPNSKVVEQLVPLGFDASLASSGVFGISISDAMAEGLLQRGARKGLKELQDKLDTGDLLGGINLSLNLGGAIDIIQEKKTGRNVLAVLPVGDKPDPHVPPVMIGAHIDHLGNKGGSNSRAKGDEANKIHHGADDNASGVAGVLEIAQWLSDLKKQGKLKLKRDVVFALWSGEESGLLGSNAFANKMAKMIFGKEDAKLGMMFSAYLNMDMIGRFDKQLVLQAVGSSSVWPKEIEQRNAPVGLPITTQNDPHLPTDSATFYLRGVPTLNAFTGSHADYHMPSDTAEKLNYERAVQITKLMGLITRSLAVDDKKPDFKEMATPKNQGTRGGMRVYLGTIPDYSQGDTKGVKLSGVSSIGPAAKAGVKGGDIIIKLGGKEVLNIYDYTSLMGELKVGKETSITVLREGKEMTLKLMPSSRE